jgi:hypothetical protein
MFHGGYLVIAFLEGDEIGFIVPLDIVTIGIECNDVGQDLRERGIMAHMKKRGKNPSA